MRHRDQETMVSSAKSSSGSRGRRAAVVYQEEFVPSESRPGLKLFTCRWLPESCSPGTDVDSSIKGLVFLCHGYGVECSVFMGETGTRLAQAGYAVFGIDHQGHGRSEGKRCYIRDFDHIVKDCVAFFRSVVQITSKDHDRRSEGAGGGGVYRGKPRFLLGESMGGALALRVHMEMQEWWDGGAVLVAPMCKISDKLKPPRWVVSLLKQLARAAPTWKVVPSNDIIDTGFHDPAKRRQLRSNPLAYQDRPRLKTALELLRASTHLERSLSRVTLPFLVLHGEDDAVTDPGVSRELYRLARTPSCHKQLIITYPGMWHSLLFGESAPSLDLVFRDIVLWLDHRVQEIVCVCGCMRRGSPSAGSSSSSSSP